jgi:hypothetical protein
MRKLALYHLHLILMVIRFVSQLRFVLFNQFVSTTRVSFFLVLESLLESLLLGLIELSELVELFFRLLVNLLQLRLMQTFFLLQLDF